MTALYPYDGIGGLLVRYERPAPSDFRGVDTLHGQPDSVGVNDVTGLTSLKKWRSNLSQLIQELQAHSPGVLIGLAGMPPLGRFPLLPQPLRAMLSLRGKLLDEVARQVSDGYHNTLHVPLDFEPDPDQFSADGYHPSEESYSEFGCQIVDRLLTLEAMNDTTQKHG